MNTSLIKEILDKDELAGDILRVLNIFGNVLWESEIRWEIQGMNSTLQAEVDLSKIDEKLKLLMEKGIIKMEKRVKGSMSGEVIEEYLVRLLNPYLVSSVLRSDDKIRRYMEARREAYKKFMEK